MKKFIERVVMFLPLPVSHQIVQRAREYHMILLGVILRWGKGIVLPHDHLESKDYQPDFNIMFFAVSRTPRPRVGLEL